MVLALFLTTMGMLLSPSSSSAATGDWWLPTSRPSPDSQINVTGEPLKGTNSAGDVRGFVAQAKANPGKLAYGYGSSGSQVSAALFVQMTGIDAQPVAYKSIPPAVTDLIGGQIQFAFVDIGNAVAQLQGGKLKALGVTLARRASRAPNVPTIAEQGVAGYELPAWFGLMAPAGTPPAIAFWRMNSLSAM